MWKARGNYHIIFPSNQYGMSQQKNLVAGNSGTLSNSGVGPGRRRDRASQVEIMRNPCKSIATWNVRTMLRVGKLENIKREMRKHKINIMGLAETRWMEEGEFQSEEYLVIHSGSVVGQGGVALIMDKQTAAALTEAKVISNRMIMIRLSSEPTDTVIAQIYMPTTGHED